MEKIHRIEEITRLEMAGFTDPRIREIRIMGACVCIEVYDPAVLKGYAAFARQRGVFSRPFLSYLYAMVPYIISEAELVQVLDTMKAWFQKTDSTLRRLTSPAFLVSYRTGGASNMDTEKIGALLRQLRLERGMTQKEAALALQISDKTISKWERGVSHS